ncbi:mechanosensitive ion channel domain-containing protein [Kitasatospora griseola]
MTACALLPAARRRVRAPEGIGHLLVLAAIGSCGWLTARAAVLVLALALVLDGAVRLAVRRCDAARAGRARIRAGLLGRIPQAGIALLALAVMLMTFPAVRVVGTSLLTSAGPVGVVAGIAAQSARSNLFAGLRTAVGDLVRIGDVVMVGGEWGTVEEITLTAVVTAAWDQ